MGVDRGLWMGRVDWQQSVMCTGITQWSRGLDDCGIFLGKEREISAVLFTQHCRPVRHARECDAYYNAPTFY